MSRTLVIGDIHGCFDELQDLLAAAGLGADDRIVSVGDLVDRGPDSPAVYRFFREMPSTAAIMGNHERKHVHAYAGRVSPSPSVMTTRAQFGEESYPDAVEWMSERPTFLDLGDALVVHGFWEPGVSLENQMENVLTGVLSGEERLRRQSPTPWYERYDGPKPLIVGHHDHHRNGEPLIHGDRVFGIDLGCVTGGWLCGLVLPEFRIVKVRARANHWSLTSARHSDDLPRIKALYRPLAERPFEELDGMADQASLPGRQAAALLAECRELEGQLLGFVAAEHQRILDSLAPADTPEAFARAYSAAITRKPLAPLLHGARKGTLDGLLLRRQLRTPGKLREFCVAELGLAPDQADDPEE